MHFHIKNIIIRNFELIEWIGFLMKKGFFKRILVNKFSLTSIVIVFIFFYFFRIGFSLGESMKPTFPNWAIQLDLKKYNELERFDIVTFHLDEQKYLKRIIGLPGDHIAFINDDLYINHEKIDEPHLLQYKQEVYHFVQLTLDFTLEDVTNEAVVPQGHYFVMGDNRRYSTDSRDRSIGFVPQQNITSKTIAILAPFSEMKLLD